MRIRSGVPGPAWPELILSDRSDTPLPPAARLRTNDDEIIILPVDRWHEQLTAEDAAVLARAEGAVLDVGCGPGRHVGALANLGVPALGVDISEAAVAATRRRGARALRASIFDPLPNAGCWATVLLLDGNIGIGGDELALLVRVAEVLRPGGHVLVEVEHPAVQARRISARVEMPGWVGPWFPWVRVTARRLETMSALVGYTVEEVWEAAGRWFVDLSCLSAEPAIERKAG